MKDNKIFRSISAAFAMAAAAALAATFVSCSGGGGFDDPYTPSGTRPGKSPGSSDDGRSIIVSAGRGGDGGNTRAWSGGDLHKGGGERWSEGRDWNAPNALGGIGSGKTRVHLSGSSLVWDEDDAIGVFISGDASLPNLPLTADEGDTNHTTFSNDLSSVSGTLKDELENGTSFNYRAYFPHDGNASSGAIPFTVPSIVSTTAEAAPSVDADSPYGLMVADPINSSDRTIIHNPADRPDILAHQKSVHFNFNPILSFAEIELECLVTQTIDQIVITAPSGSNIAGSYTYDINTGLISGGGGNTITVNISGGLQNGKTIYVPIAPVTVSGNFTFKFRYTISSGSTRTNFELTKSVVGTTFQSGKIHHLNVIPPAEFTNSANIPVITGNYYIEAWGGDGGDGEGVATPVGGITKGRGGISQKVTAFYNLSGGSVDVYIGTAGEHATGKSSGGRNATSGGSNGMGDDGMGRGSGGPGGGGGTGGGNASGDGGGGGAGTFILRNNALPSLTSLPLLVSGGGGGGGGKAYASNGGPTNGGNGGNGGLLSNANGDGSNGGAGDGLRLNVFTWVVEINGGGAGGSNRPENSTGGQAGNTGTNGAGLDASGSGAGGGGGGYAIWDGVVRGGGNPGSGGPRRESGGGGVGGSSYPASDIVNYGQQYPAGYVSASLPSTYSISNNDRQNGRDGYVVITVFR